MESNDSPSFNKYHDNDFGFSNDETPTSITTTTAAAAVATTESTDINIRSNTQTSYQEDEIEFEFPIEDHISPKFPLFDRTLLSDINHNPKSEIEPAPVRLSLGKLLIHARNSGSCSSSDADELDGITPETYCVWNPNESRRKHKKSNSVSIGNSSKRWNVRDLLKRSYSDDSYTTGNVSPVLLFSPPISPKPKVKNDSGTGVASSKTTVNKVPAYKGKIGNIRLPAYYPYRQDQIGVFGNNNNGSSKTLHRY